MKSPEVRESSTSRDFDMDGVASLTEIREFRSQVLHSQSAL